MSHLLICNPRDDPATRRAQARALGVTLAPGFSWSDPIVVVTNAPPPASPAWVAVGPSDFAGLPGAPRVGPPALPPPTEDWAWAIAVASMPGFTWQARSWIRTATGRRVVPATAARLTRRAAVHAEVLRRRAGDLQARRRALQENPVVAARVVHRSPDGTLHVRATLGFSLVVPPTEQVRRHALGESLVVRLTGSFGVRATERDPDLLTGIARRILGPDYAPPLRTVWPITWGAPRVALVLVDRPGYRPWMRTLRVLQAVTGRSVRLLRAATPPHVLVQQALRSWFPVVEDADGFAVLVPAAAYQSWSRTHRAMLPLVASLVGRPVRPRRH